MTIAAIRSGLDTALATTGVDRVYPEDIDHLEPPAIVIGNPTVPTYDDDFGGDITYVFPVYLIASRGAGVDFAVRNIDPFIEPTGSSSIAAAIRSHNNLSGSCASCKVLNATPGEFVWNDVSYLGMTFEVEVMT